MSVDREVLEAAQALCMLAVHNREQQGMNRNETPEDDDCIITDVRPVVKREQDADGDDTEDDDCVITLVRPVNHRYHPYMRPEPRQLRPAVDRPRTMPDPDAERTLVRNPLPVEQPSRVEHRVPRARDIYSVKSFALQALLAVPAGQWVATGDMVVYLVDKYPELQALARAPKSGLLDQLCSAMLGLQTRYVVERQPAEPGQKTQNVWRVPTDGPIRQRAIGMAWKPRSLAGKRPSKVSDSKVLCKSCGR